MTFSCPHYNFHNEICEKLRVQCVPGRPGCVLAGKVTFSKDVNERIRKTKKPVPNKTKRKKKTGK